MWRVYCIRTYQRAAQARIKDTVMTACKFKNALQLAFLLVALSFGATAQAALVQYYIFLYSGSGQTGAGTFKIDDTQLSSDGLKPISNLEINWTTAPLVVFNVKCTGVTWQAYVNTATVTKVRHLANTPVAYSCGRGATAITLTSTLETGDTTGRYFQYTVTGTGPHGGETGKYVIKAVNTLPEPGTVALLLGGLAALVTTNRLWARQRKARQQPNTLDNFKIR